MCSAGTYRYAMAKTAKETYLISVLCQNWGDWWAFLESGPLSGSGSCLRHRCGAPPPPPVLVQDEENPENPEEVPHKVLIDFFDHGKNYMI